MDFVFFINESFQTCLLADRFLSVLFYYNTKVKIFNKMIFIIYFFLKN